MRVQLSLFGVSLLAAAGVWLSSCEQTTEALESRKQRENAEEIQQYIRANNLQATELGNTGVFYVKTVSAPTNQSAVLGDEVKFFATSRRFDGVVIDSTDGKNPISYAFGVDLNSLRRRELLNGSYLYNNITDGMLAGLIVGREGERITLLVPSYYDNGRYGTLQLPQYSPIRYDIRITSIRTETEQIDEYIKANKITVTDTVAGGIRIAKLRTRPDSALITPGQSVTVNYTGKLLNNVQFDSRVDSSYSFIVAGGGDTQPIEGWTRSIQRVRRGEKLHVIIPSSLAYGASGRRNSAGQFIIPPYSPLFFEIDVKRVK